MQWTQEKRDKVLEQRASGMTYKQIGAEWGVSAQRARQICKNEETRRLYGFRTKVIEKKKPPVPLAELPVQDEQEALFRSLIPLMRERGYRVSVPREKRPKKEPTESVDCLSPRTRSCMRAENLHSKTEVMESYRANGLRRIPGFGKTTRAEVLEWLGVTE